MFPPTEMDMEVEYQVFQHYCDIFQHGQRNLDPTRIFFGTIDFETISNLPMVFPAPAHMERVGIASGPIILDSIRAGNPSDFLEEHTFDTDMSGGQMLDVSASNIADRVVDGLGRVKSATILIEVTVQTPAPELLVEDANAGWPFDREYRYVIFPGGTNTSMPQSLESFNVPPGFRRGQTFVEITVEEDLIRNNTAIIFIRRRSRQPNGPSQLDTSNPATNTGNISISLDPLCFLFSEGGDGIL